MTMHPVTLTRKNLPASSRRTSRLPLALEIGRAHV